MRAVTVTADRLRFRDKHTNLAGHVQFFNPESLSMLVGRHVSIVDSRRYASLASAETVRFFAQKDGLPRHRRWIKHLTVGVLPRVIGPIWKRYWVGNYALLCQKKVALSNGVTH